MYFLSPSLFAILQMVRDKLIEFVRETARHITSTADVSPELQQLRYCLCSVARQCGMQLGEALPQAFPPQVSRPPACLDNKQFAGGAVDWNNRRCLH